MSAAAAANVEGRVDSAIVGWRSWRVLPFETLDGSRSYRLCASGRYGLPKLWEPRRAVEAVCGKFATTHAAPWADCECGLHAYAEREQAEDHLRSFVDSTNGEGAAGWAFGRVALWGRVVECEHGWRAQYAYPYELTVHGPAAVAGTIGGLYAVEVESGPALEPTPPDDEDELEELDGLRRELVELRGLLERVEATVASAPSEEADEEADEDLVAPLFDFDRDEALLALFRSLARVRTKWNGLGEPPTVTVTWRRDEEIIPVAWALLAARSIEGKATGSHVHRLRRRLREAERDGLVRSGLPSPHESRIWWRFTEPGVEYLRGLDLPETFEATELGRNGATLEARVADGLARIAKPLEVSELFADEIDAMKPGWEAERREAQAQGRRAYAAWLRRFRKGADACRLYYSDDELEAALHAAAKRGGGPVAFAAVMRELAPGKCGRQEAARVSQALVRLHRTGRAVRVDGPTKLWGPADAPGGEEG